MSDNIKRPEESDHPAVLLLHAAQRAKHEPDCAVYELGLVPGRGPLDGCTCWVNHAHQVALDNAACELHSVDFRAASDPPCRTGNFRIRAGIDAGRPFVRITFQTADAIIGIREAMHLRDMMTAAIDVARKRARGMQ